MSLDPVNRVEPALFKGSGKVLGDIPLDKSFLEEERKVTLINAGLPGVLLLVVLENCLPGRFQRAKNSHIQGLELVGRIWGQAHKGNVVCPAGIDDSRGEM